MARRSSPPPPTIPVPHAGHLRSAHVLIPDEAPPTLSLRCRVSILFFFLALEPSRAAPVAGASTNSGRRPPIPRTQFLLVFPCTYSKLSRAQPRVSPTGIDPAPAGHHWSTSKLYPRRRFTVSGELLLDSLRGEHLLPSLARFPSSPGLLPLPAGPLAQPSARRRRSSSRRRSSPPVPLSVSFAVAWNTPCARLRPLSSPASPRGSPPRRARRGSARGHEEDEQW